ncbi:patatin-like phospholipase family protein [Sphingobium yanoikuyae]|jgi:NTE family protein|nr:patatin-like phospholipase family protein [Sphingobium yanoikuyae]
MIPDQISDALAQGTGDPKDGVGLCLSGGGYRAMLFHVGSLWRLAELDALRDLTRISSVSGGSITAGVLALAWPKLLAEGLPAFIRDVAGPVRKLASVTIDERAILGGIVLPGSISAYVARAYAKHLFGDATLQHLPEEPRFIFNATNLETGSLFRFTRREIRDWRVGRIPAPEVKLADAVAASSAFPPILSPFILDVAPGDFDDPLPGELSADAFAAIYRSPMGAFTTISASSRCGGVAGPCSCRTPAAISRMTPRHLATGHASRPGCSK